MSNARRQYTVVIPTLNAARHLPDLLPKLSRESTLFIDSSSNDETQKILSEEGFTFIQIERTHFNHGGTRNLCLRYCDTEFVIFLTQDALPFDTGLAGELLEPFLDPTVAATYARQLPRLQADLLEVLEREFKYPNQPLVQSRENEHKLGARTYFLSNSCAAYRLSTFRQLDGFPDSEIMGEDAIFARKLIAAGYKIIYTPTAQVYHSHTYTPVQLFKRYFDTGVYRSRMSPELQLSTKDSAQGKSYVRHILVSLMQKRQYLLVIQFLLNTAVSFLGYNSGSRYFLLPASVRRQWSMHSFYWAQFRPDTLTKKLLASWVQSTLSKFVAPVAISLALLIAYFTRSLWSNQLASLENYAIYLSLWLGTYFVLTKVLDAFLNKRNLLPLYSIIIASVLTVFVLFISRLFPVSRFVVILSVLLAALIIYSVGRTLDFVTQSVQET